MTLILKNSDINMNGKSISNMGKKLFSTKYLMTTLSISTLYPKSFHMLQNMLIWKKATSEI